MYDLKKEKESFLTWKLKTGHESQRIVILWGYIYLQT